MVSASGGANSLWLTEWLAAALELKAGMRVLDLGCGRAASSIFLRREYGVQVWATDLWFSASENLQRIRDAGVANAVFPLHADARALPFAANFFDAIVSIDSFVYYGTDDLYLNYLAQFVKPQGWMGIAGTGLMREVQGVIPKHVREWWTQDMCCLHSASWWRRHWERTGIMNMAVADTIPSGWQRWLEWQRFVAPDNTVELQAVEVILVSIWATFASWVAAALRRNCRSSACPSRPITPQSRCSGAGGTTGRPIRIQKLVGSHTISILKIVVASFQSLPRVGGAVAHPVTKRWSASSLKATCAKLNLPRTAVPRMM